MGEYRWDLHYRKAGNEGKPRCEARNFGGIRCELVVHDGHGHSAFDGSLSWLDAGWPGLDEEAE